MTTVWRTLTGSAGRVITSLLAFCYALGGFAFVAAGIIALSHRDAGVHGAALVVGFSLLTLLWPFTSLFVTGVGQTVDPGRFALFGVTASDLMPGQVVVALLGPGAVFAGGCSLVAAASWWGHPVAVVATLLGSLLGVLTCVLACRVLSTTFSRALASRRRKDAAAIVLGFIGVAIAFAGQLVNRVLRTSFVHLDALGRLGEVLGWTPLGWGWSAGWDARRGAWVVLVAHLLLAAALVVLLGLLWRRSLAEALVSPLEAGGDGGHVKDRRLADRLVRWTPAGAVAWRGLVYWRRDPRRIVQLVTAFLLPVVMVIPLVTGDEPLEGAGLLLVPALAAWTLGMSLTSSDTNQDGTALWMQVVAGLSGRDDRRGRLVSAAWVALPATLVIDLGALLVTGLWRLAPAVLGGSLGLVATSAAVGSLTSAYSQMAVPPAGRNSFGSSSGGGVQAMLVGFVGMFGSALLAVPLAVPAVFARGHAWVGWVLLLAGPLYGLAVLWVATAIGGRRLDATWPEVLHRVTWEKA